MIYRGEEYTRMEMTVGGLAAAIQKALDQQGQTWAWLSRKTGIAQATFVNWRQNAKIVPELESLAAVSGKLGVPLRTLIEACGYPVNESADYADRTARARALVAAVPRLADVAEDLASLRPEDQDALMTMIEDYLRRRRLRRGSR